ncbi:MAG: thioredoxin family protein [Xanthomonadales bacterium]|jgi:peroxiredoxin|nr:thioredoxin family protein [Xanthomonadales bacterium]
MRRLIRTHSLHRALAGAALLLAATVGLAGQYNTILDIGDPMPGFTNLPATDGKIYRSGDFGADVLVLVSLANHCPWVRGMDQGLIDLVDAFEGQSVQVVGFSVNRREDDRLPAMVEHGDRVGYNFTYLYDESQELGRALGATRTPEYFVFDADRKLTYMGLLHDSPARETRSGDIMYTNGEPTQFYAQNAIRATLAGQPVDPAETRAQGCSVKYE